jgi:hypothetical protein
MRAATRERMIRIMAGAGLVAILSFSWWSGCRRCADCLTASTQECAINVT